VSNLPDKKNESSWSDDFSDFVGLFRSEDKFLPWVRWSVLFLAIAAAIVVGALLLVQNVNNVPTSLPSPSSSATPEESPTPTATPVPTPTAAPEPVILSDELISAIPSAWKSISRDGCAQAWTAPSDGVSSVLVLDRATEAFKKAGFTSNSTWGENDLRITATGNQNGITDADLVFTTASIELCLR
jgi:hypothetical protein